MGLEPKACSEAWMAIQKAHPTLPVLFLCPDSGRTALTPAALQQCHTVLGVVQECMDSESIFRLIAGFSKVNHALMGH